MSDRESLLDERRDNNDDDNDDDNAVPLVASSSSGSSGSSSSGDDRNRRRSGVSRADLGIEAHAAKSRRKLFTSYALMTMKQTLKQVNSSKATYVVGFW